MIGIVSYADDLHTKEVCQHLDALDADRLLLDTALIPVEAAITTVQDSIDGWAGSWTADGTRRDLADLRAVWWRRPQPFRLHDEVTRTQDRAFARGECAAMLAGLWSCLDAEWVNDPDRDEAASRKMRQLRLAARLGLRVPRTCMTNDPGRAREFVAAEGGAAVFKSFSATAATWRETRPVRPGDLELMDCVRFAPVIFQELIPGGIDIRVTIVGGQVFPAEIRAVDSAYEFDFRLDSANAPISEHPLPPGLQERLLRLCAELGLRYGAVDLRLAPSGEYVFLEINPAGQWLFVEIATGQPISAAMAGLLAGLDRRPTAARPPRRNLGGAR